MSIFVRCSRGFTLIELIIVILIIAILIAIAIPVYLSANTNAERRACQSNLRMIDASINTYYAHAEVYPTAIADMLVAPYKVLKSEPRCATNGSAYALTPGSPPAVACPDSVPGHTI